MFELSTEWKPLFKADYGEAGHEVQFYSSQRGLVMLVPEKRQGRVVGAACVACKPMLLHSGESSLRSIRFTGEATVVKQLNSSLSYLLVFSTPFHVSSSGLLSAALDASLKQVEKLEYTFKRIDGVKLSNVEHGEIFTDPSLAVAFLRALRVETAEKGIIGKSVSGEPFALSPSLVSTAFTVGGTREQRLHSMHVLIEEALNSNACVVIFDSSRAFVGLAQASGLDFAAYSSFGLAGSSAGFAFKEIFPAGNAFANLSILTPKELLSIFGVSPESEVAAVLCEALAKANSFNDALAFLSSVQRPQFILRRAARLLAVMESSTKGLFAKKPFLADEVSSSIGKVFHVDLSKGTGQVQALFVLALLRSLASVDQRLLIAFEQPAHEVKSAVEFALSTFTGRDVCIACHAEHEGDLPEMAASDLLVEIIDDSAVVSISGLPPKRIQLRPAYSQCTEV